MMKLGLEPQASEPKTLVFLPSSLTITSSFHSSHPSLFSPFLFVSLLIGLSLCPPLPHDAVCLSCAQSLWCVVGGRGEGVCVCGV